MSEQVVIERAPAAPSCELWDQRKARPGVALPMSVEQAADLYAREPGEWITKDPTAKTKIDAELTRLGKRHEFHSYPGAGHAFMNEGRPSHRPEAAADAWQKCVGWFDRYLK